MSLRRRLIALSAVFSHMAQILTTISPDNNRDIPTLWRLADVYEEVLYSFLIRFFDIYKRLQIGSCYSLFILT